MKKTKTSTAKIKREIAAALAKKPGGGVGSTGARKTILAVEYDVTGFTQAEIDHVAVSAPPILTSTVRWPHAQAHKIGVKIISRRR